MAFSGAFIVYAGVFSARLWPLALSFIFISGLFWIFARRAYPTEFLAYSRSRSEGRPHHASLIETEQMARAIAAGMLARSGLLILLFLPQITVLLYTLSITNSFLGGVVIVVMLLGGLLVGIGFQRIFPRFVPVPFTPEVVDLRKRSRKIASTFILTLFIIWDVSLHYFMFMPGLRSSVISLIWLLNALSLVPICGALVYSGLFLRSVFMVRYPKVRMVLPRNLALTLLVCLLFRILIYSTNLWMGGFLFLAYAVFFWSIANRSY